MWQNPAISGFAKTWACPLSGHPLFTILVFPLLRVRISNRISHRLQDCKFAALFFYHEQPQKPWLWTCSIKEQVISSPNFECDGLVVHIWQCILFLSFGTEVRSSFHYIGFSLSPNQEKQLQKPSPSKLQICRLIFYQITSLWIHQIATWRAWLTYCLDRVYWIYPKLFFERPFLGSG